MSNFKLSADIDNNKIFLVKRSELEGRLDIDYYRPQIMNLEKKIRQKSVKKLNHFILKMASGSTPSVTEEEKFYSTAETGIPFLRVQNLNPNGEISLDNVRYINEETHNKYLKRSQVLENDLLVKITGVGRMAIASVAPQGFIGNTNQHMVVIKTASAAESRYLANYLNLDIIEALATRRATGGTRPALDYKALKSIPIIENIDFSLLRIAEEKSQKLKQQAQALLASIDIYLLTELGITLPKQDNSLEKRIFRVSSRELSGGRFDPNWNFNAHYKIEGGFYKNQLLANIATVVKGTSITYDKIITGKYPVIAGGQTSPYSHYIYNHKENVITVSASGAYAGFVWHHDYPIFASDCTVIRSKNEDIALTKFIFDILKLKQKEIYFLQQGAGQPHVYSRDLIRLQIPLPPIQKQNQIAEHIQAIRTQAKQLQTQAEQLLANAKAHIEQMILGV